MSTKINKYEVTLRGSFSTTCVVTTPLPENEVDKVVSQAFKDQMEQLQITVLVNGVEVRGEDYPQSH